MNEVTPKHTESFMVPSWYYEAFALKIRGVNYQNIADKVGKSVDTVKHIFAKSGKMYHFWREYVEATKSQNVEESLDMLFAHLPDAIRMHVVAGQDHKDNPMVALLARQKIMDYTLGKPEDRLKINASVAVMTFADWVKQDTLKEQQEKNVPKSQENIPERSD